MQFVVGVGLSRLDGREHSNGLTDCCFPIGSLRQLQGRAAKA